MIIHPNERLNQFDKVCNGEIFKQGFSLGFDSLDYHIKFAKSYLAIITGYPGSGKSEWLDAVLLNMSILHKWKVLYYSPENHPVEQHMAKLAEKLIGKAAIKFTNFNKENAIEHLQEYFTWTYPDNPTLESILDNALAVKEEKGVDVVVIDPWNALTNDRGGALTHEDLGKRLTKAIKFARDNNILVCVVAHPSKPQKEKDGSFAMPTLYDISDGAMWRNKADYGIICHRPDMGKNELIVSIQKVKQKWQGKLGMATLDYDYISGRFKSQSSEDFTMPNEEPPLPF